MASTQLSNPCTHHLSGCRRALHVLYAVPEHPGLGSLGTCHLPSSSGLQAEGGGTAKSQVSPVENATCTCHSRARSRSVPFISQCLSRRAGQSKANLPPASLPLPPASTPASSAPFTPLQQTSRHYLPTALPTCPSLPSLPPLLPRPSPFQGSCPPPRA